MTRLTLPTLINTAKMRRRTLLEVLDIEVSLVFVMGGS
jgi:hypothetical protein